MDIKAKIQTELGISVQVIESIDLDKREYSFAVIGPEGSIHVRKIKITPGFETRVREDVQDVTAELSNAREYLAAVDRAQKAQIAMKSMQIRSARAVEAAKEVIGDAR